LNDFELKCLFSTEICRGYIEKISKKRESERDGVEQLLQKAVCTQSSCDLELVKTIVNHGEAKELDFIMFKTIFFHDLDDIGAFRIFFYFVIFGSQI